ncbi:MAG: 4-hydroxythreonine-4-phosphate dehydrogenase PdxA [Ignavibacteria bacterium]|nr:4-hydroxythreonine-4-phosphate dehydrogenase PdxA [Ignavibacteria bacterium]
MKNLLKIGVTIGDVNGIGLEVFAKFLNSKTFKHVARVAKFVLYGNFETIIRYFEATKTLQKYRNLIEKVINEKVVEVKDIQAEAVAIEFGKESYESAKLAIHSIEKAVESALSKEIDCIVTLPVSKYGISLAGFKFYGHTEKIAEMCNVSNPFMLFVFKRLKVGLVTTHIPLLDVPESISVDLLQEKALILNNTLKEDFGIRYPKIALLGLNPHSGENGTIGREEVEIFTPAMERLKNKINISGPFPADGFFANKIYRKFDGILSPYHDQGLVAFKILSNNSGINYTANLPIVRTSPDHGTAYDIAGKGIATATSLINSIILAIQIAKRRKAKNG